MKPGHQPVSARLDRNPRAARPGAFHIAVAVLSLALLSGCEQNAFVPPPPPEVDVARAGTAQHHALSRSHRQYRADQVGRSGGAGAGRAAGDQLSGRRLREGRHDAVHDRARDLQAEARSGAGGRSRRAGVAEAGRGRLQAPGRPGRAAGGLAGDPRYSPPRRATTPRPICSRPRPTPRSPRSISATPTSPRRSTASSARISSRSANWSARPRRPSSPPSCSSIRST